MRRLLLALLGLVGVASFLMVAPGKAALPVGAKAPDFTTMGALAGKDFRVHLAQQLKRGPVVLYFYPKAFTQGCTLEAHAFSDAMPAFRKAGAQVIGMSADDLATLRRFSVEECRNAFPVATASSAVIKAYDVRVPLAGIANRTSYVIGQDGRILMVHSDMSWKEHVQKTLAAVQSLARR